MSADLDAIAGGSDLNSRLGHLKDLQQLSKETSTPLARQALIIDSNCSLTRILRVFDPNHQKHPTDSPARSESALASKGKSLGHTDKFTLVRPHFPAHRLSNYPFF